MNSLLHAFLVTMALTTAGEAGPPGQHVDLDGATLFIPQGYEPRGERVNIVLHLHGSPAVVEAALVEAGWPAVLIEFNRRGLSSVYSQPFSDPALFPSLIDRTLAAVKKQGLAAQPRIGRVVVSSFSAGFGGVRELLKVPAHFARIDAIALADSLYAGYTGAPKERTIDPSLMEGFRRFALEAAQGRKTLLLTHSAQVPEGYASTTETADLLIRAVGARAEPARVDWGDGFLQVRCCTQGRFVVLGFAGAEGADHLRHLRRLGRIWHAMPDPFAPDRPADCGLRPQLTPGSSTPGIRQGPGPSSPCSHRDS